mmetsp:Transcript_27236/g.40983  ORF Transcript_27236/g.40983 Transcript_27236/m.40983 type:complete len:80 (+) Transcript_27236:743-982(+)
MFIGLTEEGEKKDGSAIEPSSELIGFCDWVATAVAATVDDARNKKFLRDDNDDCLDDSSLLSLMLLLDAIISGTLLGYP